jgi:hypothetical protein
MLRKAANILLPPIQWREPLGPVWGEGLVGQSLTTLWHSCDWSNIDEDELVLFIPSLIARHAFASEQTGAVPHIQRALAERLDSAVWFLNFQDEQQTLERIAACGVISACSPREALREAQSHSRNDTCRPTSHMDQTNELGSWTFELSVLACIDRMLLDAMPTRPQPAGYIASADLADVLVASIHTSINGAYVYPQYAFAHELLATGAWLGVLLRGRSALMPEFVAQVLTDYMSGPEKSWTHAQSPIARLLEFHAELAGGSERLLRRARKVNRWGRPAFVTGRRQPTMRAVRPYIWNDLLSRRIAEQLANRLGAGHA